MITPESISPDHIEKTVQQTLDILESAKEILPLNSDQLDRFRTECEQIPDHIRDGYLKIAVAGVIKSGKSTFVNALVQKELVQRGAGVVTSITTRIRKGGKNSACLLFKSWDQINSQLQQALQLFPDDDTKVLCANGFDIRRQNDRQHLETVYRALMDEFLLFHEEKHPELLLMKYALNGFEACKDLVGADETRVCFSSNQFDRHKEFTSDPGRAFYVKDVCLELYGKSIAPHIEIADCQGADSTDPAQVKQVLRYIESASLVIYCISSRTGLRQSDIQFLTRIERLGRLENMIFVINCDLSEHETLDDLIRIETATRQTLEALKIKPQIFSFSALYNLFAAQSSRLRKKDQARMELWQTEKKLVDYCTRQTHEFNTYFNRIIEKDAYGLLISNHVNRLAMLLHHLDDQADMALDLLSSDATRQAQAARKLESLYQSASRLETIVNRSLDGVVTDLVKEIHSDMRTFFDQDDQDILNDVRNFIEALPVDVEKYRSGQKDFGFNKILYLLFQDLKNRLDMYVIQTVQPKVNQFVKYEQSRISSYFKSLSDTYRIDLLETDQKPESSRHIFSDTVDIDKIIKILGLELPECIFSAVYTSKTRLNVFTDFGLHTIFNILKAAYKKQETVSFTPGLNKAVSKIKHETVKDLKNQFEACGSTLHQYYFTPLIDAAVRDFKEKISQQFHQYDAFKKQMDEQILLKQSLKQEQKIKIADIKNRIQRTVKDIRETGEISPR
ncbi:MAG: dynamin family protein [Proteobacteria bacterium]|nr:dynamin family protein [Pseudomonadota bacterium]MBU1388790.1 dynamin family protein [Pseudomonadota bacterium]MBU1543131.1 dynamin family protein [Pseudomonadota bacterium]MBU2481721.1 dynamin family protein [Pseudomonadota bacterium]